MYLDFYRLREKPFNTTPDPKFLLMTAGHREALAQLVYGVEEQKGFIVLIGEVGTGKTTLLRALLSRLSESTAAAFVFNSTLPFDEILAYILEDFGIAKAAATRVERLVALNRFLIERRRVGQNTVVIIDEAQNLDVETLEQVRLLSNFETTTDKLLQILLVGQPELKAKLMRPELRQLRQRVGLRCSLAPLTAEETREYVVNRLGLAGGDRRLFTDGAIQRVAKYAGGIPRVINVLCDHSLLIGYADQTRRIDRTIVDRAIAYLEGEDRPTATRGPGAPSLAAVVRQPWAQRTLAALLLAVVVAAAAPMDWASNVSRAVSALLTTLPTAWKP